MNPKISVIVPCYNQAEFMGECLQLVLDQTYQDWECIIVDDCSTDNSVELIKNCIGNDSRFYLTINEKNKGCGYTKRKCAELANGDILGFVDPDDSIVAEAIEKMILAHQRYSDAPVVHSKWKAYDENWNFLYDYTKSKDVKYHLDFFKLNGEITHFVSFKKEKYSLTNGINENLKRAVDLDLYLKLIEVGETHFIDEFLYNYRLLSNGISIGNNEILTYYWNVIMSACNRRGNNAEKLIRKSQYMQIEKENKSLRNFSILNKIYKTLTFQKR